MPSHVTVSSLVALREGCPVSCEVGGSGCAWIRFGSTPDGLEFEVDSEVLRDLVRAGTEALTQMDALYAQETADANKGASTEGSGTVRNQGA